MRKWQKNYRIINGFHLIELMIVVVIVALLVTLALPHYAHHIAHTHRQEAELQLLSLANALEVFALKQGSYSGATLEELGFSETVAKGHYQLQLAKIDANHFLIQAIPDETQNVDDNCGILSITELGNRKPEERKYPHCW